MTFFYGLLDTCLEPIKLENWCHVGGSRNSLEAQINPIHSGNDAFRLQRKCLVAKTLQKKKEEMLQVDNGRSGICLSFQVVQ